MNWQKHHWQYDSRPLDFYVGLDFGRMMFGLLVKNEDGWAIAIGLGPLYVGTQR